ncbi:hydroxyacid oxidase 1-like [Branchiostoma floridae]|uniref:(S)-2-hydroxy-acid oxidase n=1 Tax=Branchiostoma floridae TaxID=7739 RepID=A0A9J7KQJ9_BRAFL|nr:hydroxyacid oxidase 1-like [Branchiostoma floridae]
MAEGLISDLTCVLDFEKEARKKLSGFAWQFFSRRRDAGQTYQDNVDAFKRYRLIPRNLRDVSIRDTTVTVLGTKLDFPVAIAPTAMQRLAHPDAELATAKGAASVNTGMVLSSWANHSLEEVAKAAPRGVRWFYLLFFKDRRLTRHLLERAQRAGYTAIVLTADQPSFSFSRHEKPTLPPVLVRYPNAYYAGDPVGLVGTVEVEEHLRATVKVPGTWEDVGWVRKNTKLPVVLKGILSAEDARTAVNLGVDAVYVSNHGGRQMDGLPATIDVLPDIVRAVDGKAEVYLDGGVRTGTDVLKALSLGARCVFIGRPALWGLACNGAEGVGQVLRVLRDEFSLAMARAGCAKVADITSSLVLHESYYSSRQLRHPRAINDKKLKSKY